MMLNSITNNQLTNTARKKGTGRREGQVKQRKEEEEESVEEATKSGHLLESLLL